MRDKTSEKRGVVCVGEVSGLLKGGSSEASILIKDGTGRTQIDVEKIELLVSDQREGDLLHGRQDQQDIVPREGVTGELVRRVKVVLSGEGREPSRVVKRDELLICNLLV